MKTRAIGAAGIIAAALAAAAGWGALLPDEGVALPQRETIRNRCRCMCDGPTGGSENTYNNTTGVSCDRYVGRTCNRPNVAGGSETGTLVFCKTVTEITATYRAATPAAKQPEPSATTTPDASRALPK